MDNDSIPAMYIDAYTDPIDSPRVDLIDSMQTDNLDSKRQQQMANIIGHNL